MFVIAEQTDTQNDWSEFNLQKLNRIRLKIYPEGNKKNRIAAQIGWRGLIVALVVL